jgi:hypothetical protein
MADAVETTEASSRTGALMHEVRRMPLYRQLVPAEAGVGWPLARQRADRPYVALPFFGMPPSATPGESQLYPPFATITLDWQTGKPVSYTDLHASALWPPVTVPVGTFPHDEIRRLTRGQYLELREELLRLCDQVLGSFAGLARFPPESAARYRKLWRVLMEPSLEPYYRHLAPGFSGRLLPPRRESR